MPNNPEFATLEEAQAEIIRLREELTERTNERDTLSQNNQTLTDDNTRLRNLNQTYFNKLSAQYTEPADEKKDEEEEVQTCEEYALTLKF